MASISGDLTFASVPTLLERASELVADPELDVSGVGKADSAGVALLLELTRQAKRGGRSLAIRGVPSQLGDLIRFFDLQSALELDGAA